MKKSVSLAHAGGSGTDAKKIYIGRRAIQQSRRFVVEPAVDIVSCTGSDECDSCLRVDQMSMFKEAVGDLVSGTVPAHGQDCVCTVSQRFAGQAPCFPWSLGEVHGVRDPVRF